MIPKIIKSFFLSIFIISNSFASSMVGNINLEEATSDSLKISWEENQDALCYNVSYDTESQINGMYDNVDICVDGNEHTIEGLSENTDYFIAMNIVNQDASESELSDEVVFKTLDKESSSSIALKLENTNVENTRQIKLSFNLDIDPEAQREFKIVDKDDSLIELDIDNTEIIGTKDVLITVSNDLEPNKEFNLTVLSLSGINGENIELGVDGIVSFIIPENLTIYTEDDTNENLDTDSEENIELNAAGTESGSSLVGANLSEDEIENNIATTAQGTNNLPETGPEHILLIIFSLILAIILFRLKFVKS